MMENTMHDGSWFFFGHGFFGLLWWIVIIAVVVWVIKTLGSSGDDK